MIAGALSSHPLIVESPASPANCTAWSTMLSTHCYLARCATFHFSAYRVRWNEIERLTIAAALCFCQTSAPFAEAYAGNRWQLA